MKYIKAYENWSVDQDIVTMYNINQREPEVGDYVICEDGGFIWEFTSTNIGQIISFDPERTGEEYLVKYENIPSDIIKYLRDGTRRMSRTHEIIYWSKSKKDLEMIIATKKYNV